MNTLPDELSKTHLEAGHKLELAYLAKLTGMTPAEIEGDLLTPDAHARAEPVAVAQCDHDADTNGTDAEYLEILSTGGGEIYLCDCGALIDYGHTDNYEPPYRPMTIAEITRAVSGAFANQRTGLIEAIREAINKTNPA